MKQIINENQRGFLFKNGKFVKLLQPGKYHVFGSSEIKCCNIENDAVNIDTPIDILLKDKDFKEQTTLIEINDDNHIALHFVDGEFTSVCECGKYAFWNVYNKHTFKIIDISDPETANDVPQIIFNRMPYNFYVKINVAEHQKARLCFNCKFNRILDAGVYYFWNRDTSVSYDIIDTRLTKMDITGQEMLTKDKVAIRVNFVCNYRITDAVRILSEIDDYKEQIRIAGQLAMRNYVGKLRIDEILENKDEMSRSVFEYLKSKEKELFVEFSDSGVKDIILPGEIRDIMNTVLVAEKRAQANVITRREEVASTRSLLNTAKLMDENKTLYRLKEMEYIERICENVGSLSLSGSSDILTQLIDMIRKPDANRLPTVVKR